MPGNSVAIITFGCRLNQAETATLAGELRELGFNATPDWESPDCAAVIIHSCAITRAAESDCRNQIRRIKRHSGNPPLIVFTGCAAETIAAESLREDGADVIVPQAEKFSIPSILAKRLRPDAAPVGDCATPHFFVTRAPIKIQDGCSFRCAYCIVPTTRGAPRSRPLNEILDEAAAVIESGHKELVITGVNIGCYIDGSRKLPDLIQALSELPGLGRIRLGSMEPGTVERQVADIAAVSDKICRFLHAPMQSGDAAILKAMRRHYTPAQFEESIRYTVGKLPNMGLGTDIITGFPGETDAAFQSTIDMVERLPFNNLHVFPYSERPGTPAARMPGVVPMHVRRERTAALNEIGAKKRKAFIESFIGKPADIIVESIDETGAAFGWTGEYIRARVPPAAAPHAVGALIRAPYSPAE